MTVQTPYNKLDNLTYGQPFEGFEEAFGVYMDDFNKEEEKRQKRKQRILDCGRFAHYFDPYTGQKAKIVMYCDLFRECPTCRRRRAEREGKWITETFYSSKNGMQLAVIEKKEDVDKLLRGVHKKKYIRYPQDDGREYVFLDGSIECEDAYFMNPDMLREIDWETVVCTPPQRNKSGTMHVPKSTESPEPFQIIEINQFVADASTSQINNAMDYAISLTLDLLPETADDVQEAINQRVSIATERLKEQGIYVRSYKKKLKVVKSRIKWSKFALNNTSTTKNPTYNSGDPP